MENLLVHITTLGCSKNLYDSEILGGMLKKNGAKITTEPEESDVIIINTCGFIGPAKEESVQAVLEAVELKKTGKVKKIIVFGCMIVRYKNELQKEIPEVDAYYNTEDYKNILNEFNFKLDKKNDYFSYRNIKPKSHTAYIKIAEGCNHKCSFCAIPQIRGKHKSRTIENIVKEAEMLAKQGVKEIIIISQDSTYYGIDLYGKQKITELIENLSKIEKLEWIRLHYFYPTTLPDSLINLMANNNKILPYVDIPLQHISNRMLKIMKRSGNKEQIILLLNKLREKIDDITIRTTFIVGHPGETEEDFEELKNFIKNFKFERVGIFKYSDEENTGAYSISEKVDDDVIEKRFSELMEIQKEISFEKNQKQIGQIKNIIIDEKLEKQNMWIGRTVSDSPEIDNEVYVSLKNDSASINIGDIISSKVVDAEEYDLYAIKED